MATADAEAGLASAVVAASLPACRRGDDAMQHASFHIDAYKIHIARMAGVRSTPCADIYAHYAGSQHARA